MRLGRLRRLFRSEQGYLAVVTAFLIVPALLGVIMIYDAGIIMVGRMGAYDTAHAIAQLAGAQRYNQIANLAGDCDTTYLTDRIEALATNLNWDPFTIEKLELDSKDGRIVVEVSVVVDRAVFGEERYTGYAWGFPSKVFSAVTGGDEAC